MEQLVNKLVDMGLEQFMDNSRQVLIMADDVYLQDIKDKEELEQRYMNLNLPSEQGFIINDYIACLKTAYSRYADISYKAGIIDAVEMLAYLELLKDTENNSIDTKLE